MAVNNNAAAVMLILSSLAKGGEVVVSRGELVEIGGKFRIPDVMEQSGATLVEVGTTNKTHLSDYEEAVTEETRALLKVHTSNYRIVGFTETVEIDELIPLAREKDIPVIEDLGSGVLIDLSRYGRGQASGRPPGRHHRGKEEIYRYDEEKSAHQGAADRQVHGRGSGAGTP